MSNHENETSSAWDTFKWDKRWRIYAFPSYAWFAPELPEGALLIGTARSPEEASNLLGRNCTNINGLYVPQLPMMHGKWRDH